jgi:mono/diheme cytochrome c family protein
LAIACVVAGLLASCAGRPVIEPAAAPPPSSFDAGLVGRGAELAAIGNCASCHTSSDGPPYAGGFPVHTPFGTVYGTNLTPDVETGIGHWSLDAFTRAMREGLDREGRHLYPAFPYPHFTRVRDEDIEALYAFLMTRAPVAARPPANTVIVPRPLLGVWKALYFVPGRFHDDPNRDARWNRGAYLAEGLAHCGACHTPRNQLGAELVQRGYAGARVSDWQAPALDATSTSPVPWTEDALARYLDQGIVRDHALAAGPMAGVVRNLAHAAPDDVRDVARYISSLDDRPEVERDRRASRALASLPRARARGSDDPAWQRGEQLYNGACAACHDRGRAVDGGALPLPLAIAITLPQPSNLIHIVRAGILPQEHEQRRWMPAFGPALTDSEVVDLAVYLRSMTGRPAWSNLAEAVRNVHDPQETAP